MKDKYHFQELMLLKEIAETINRTYEMDSMLQEVLNRLLELTGLETGWVFLIDSVTEHYRLAADVNLPHALSMEHKQPMCEGSCWCLGRYFDGTLDRASNILNCKRLEQSVLLNRGDTRGITHHATIPLRYGEEKFGILNVASPGKTAFSEEELAMLQAVALQIGTAAHRIRLYERSKLLARWEERNRIARDLHDSVSQMLFALQLRSRGMEALLQGESEQVRQGIGEIGWLAREALAEMRRMIGQLRPAGLEDGLLTGLSRYGATIGLHVEFDAGELTPLADSVEEALWRIGQEALNNVSKHAGIDRAMITIIYDHDHVVMTISDQGGGLPGEPSDGYGMSTMRERAEALGGTVQVTSRKGEGTVVRAAIPLGKRGEAL